MQTLSGRLSQPGCVPWSSGPRPPMHASPKASDFQGTISKTSSPVGSAVEKIEMSWKQRLFDSQINTTEQESMTSFDNGIDFTIRRFSREHGTDAPALAHGTILHGRSPWASSSIASCDASTLAALACAGFGTAMQSLQVGPWWVHPVIAGKVAREGGCRAVPSWSSCNVSPIAFGVASHLAVQGCCAATPGAELSSCDCLSLQLSAQAMNASRQCQKTSVIALKWPVILQLLASSCPAACKFNFCTILQAKSSSLLPQYLCEATGLPVIELCKAVVLRLLAHSSLSARKLSFYPMSQAKGHSLRPQCLI